EVGGLVAGDDVVEHVNPVSGQDHHAGAGGHLADDIAFGRKVLGVVVDDLVVEDPGMVTGLGQVGHVEHQDAAGIVGGDVVIHIGVDGIFGFDARHVVFGAAAANDDIAGLTDINAGIRCADGHAVFNQHVVAVDGIETVG